MESIIGIYKRLYDPSRPVVCMDENSKQQVKEVCGGMAAKPEHPERYDAEWTESH